MKTKVIIIGVVIAVLITVTFTLKSNKRTVEANVYRPDVNKRVLVQAQTAQLRKLIPEFSYTGSFAPFREVILIPQVNGEVESVYFNEGDQVKEGSTLLQIDDDLLQAQYVSAEANYFNAKQSLARHESASASGAVSNMQLDNLKLNVTTAASYLEQLAKQIRLNKIVAPFSGTMTLKSVEPGSVVGGSAVARITDLTQLKLELSVPEKEIVMFHENETAMISSDIYPGKTFTGKIEYVSDRADEAHNYVVRVLIKNNSSTLLKAGMYGTASLKGTEKQALMIPRAALLGSAKNPQVFAIENGTAVLKNIRTGFAENESVEILEGLKAGEVVVLTGHINLSSGSKVEIVK
ncbi:MAG: efflux RND transporter periplasmic adaptor subunit [Cyclobacteriaceae bacterium]|nr:efflux RND transporter periplasmic adaptor subunit [Cyclobacteriaceae bacterium]